MSNRIVSRSLMGALCSACFTTANAQERPNIIVFFSRRHGINGHLRSLCYGRKRKCTETTVKRLVSYSQYGAPGKPGNPLFHFLCTKREFPSGASIMTGQNAARHPHYELDQCGKQQPHSIRTIRLELERAHSSGYDLSLFITTSRIQNDPCG